MKKIFLSSLLFVMLISMSFENSNSSCPSGYVSQTINFPIPGISPTCTASIEICYHCNPTGISDVIIGTLTVPACADISWFLVDANWNTFEDFIYANINYGSCNPAPCDQGGTSFTVKSHRISCCYVQNQVVGGVHYSSLLIPCDPDGAYCESTYNVCWDGTKYVSTYVSSTPVGTPGCSATKPTLPLYPYTWNDPWSTSCFNNTCGR
jgi:hypothetical protein